MKVLIIGWANFNGSGGGSRIHTAQITSLLPKFGFEVIYSPYPSTLMQLQHNDDLAIEYYNTMKLMEKKGVSIPSIVYSLIENNDRYNNKLDEDHKKALKYRVQEIAKRRISYLLPDHFLYSDSIVDLAKKLIREASGVHYIINAIGELPIHEFVYISSRLKKPTYHVMHHNPFLPYFHILKLTSRLAPDYFNNIKNLIWLPDLYNITKFYYNNLIKQASLSFIWINPASYISFKRTIDLNKDHIKNYFLYPANAICPLTSKYKTYDKEPYLVFGGHLDSQKGLYDLPMILKYLKNRIDDDILLTGHSSIESTKQVDRLKQIYPKIKLIGYVKERERLFEIFSKAKTLIYPTHLDGYSLTILESLGVGTPVVAYGIPELVHVYKKVRAVRLVKEFDFKSFAEEIVKLSKNDNTEELFSDEYTKDFIKLHSSWENVAEQYAKILGNTL